jgi:hypothetical protein
MREPPDTRPKLEVKAKVKVASELPTTTLSDVTATSISAAWSE